VALRAASRGCFAVPRQVKKAALSVPGPARWSRRSNSPCPSDFAVSSRLPLATIRHMKSLSSRRRASATTSVPAGTRRPALPGPSGAGGVARGPMSIRPASPLSRQWRRARGRWRRSPPPIQTGDPPTPLPCLLMVPGRRHRGRFPGPALRLPESLSGGATKRWRTGRPSYGPCLFRHAVTGRLSRSDREIPG